MSAILSIETGFSCNALCGFCPQLGYRGKQSGGLEPDLSTEEIRERIRFGARNGYRQIGFSGGEPTIRKDFIDLIAYARSQGFRLIAVTTNGMMMGYPAFAAACVRAGLNSINLSINGHTARLHDAMMRTPGSFDQAMKALDNLKILREHSAVRLEIMSMSLAAPQVVGHFADIIRLTGHKGVKLHMIQPFLMSKGNTHLAHHYLTSYEAVAQAIREGVVAARQHGGRIKLFNTPVCLLADIEEQLERQWKTLDVFREHERVAPGELSQIATHSQRETRSGCFRIEACATCPEPCDGFRMEYYPQQRMVAEILDDLDAHIAAQGAGELWIGGLELLSGESRREVLQAARAKGAKRLVLLSGGIGRAYHEQFEEAVQALVDEVHFVVQPPRLDKTGLEDRHLAHGNFGDIAKGLKHLRDRPGHEATTVSATASVYDLWRDPSALERLAELGIHKLYIGEEGHPQPDAPSFFDGAGFAELQPALARLGFEVTLLRKGETGGPAERLDWQPRLLRHRYTAHEAEWIGWSIPPWSRELPWDAVAWIEAALQQRSTKT